MWDITPLADLPVPTLQLQLVFESTEGEAYTYILSRGWAIQDTGIQMFVPSHGRVVL